MRSVPEILRWLDARLTRPHDRAAFDLSPTEQGAISEGSAFGHKSHWSAAKRSRMPVRAPQSGA